MRAPFDPAPRENARPYSQDPWVDQRCRDALAKVLPALIERLTPHGLRFLFLGGSACLGEALGWDSPRRVLSDLDLGAVTERWVPFEAQEDLRRWLAEQRQVDGPEVTIGCYEARRLGEQAPTLGWVDLSRHAVTLFGDPRWRERFLAPDAERIPHYEGTRLIGNRALELWREAARIAGAPAGDGEAVLAFAHALAKAATGLGASWLVRRGEYVSTLAARLDLLDRLRGQLPTELRAAIDAFRPYFDRPHAGAVPHGGVELYRLALRRLLDEAGESPLERGLLLEPLRMRDVARGYLRARRLGFPVGSLLRQAVANGDPLGTFDGRRWALAVRYWLEEGEGDAWRRAGRRWIGYELPHEPRAVAGLDSPLDHLRCA